MKIEDLACCTMRLPQPSLTYVLTHKSGSSPSFRAGKGYL